MVSQPLASESVVIDLASIERRLACQFSRRVQHFHITIASDGLILEGRTSTYFTKSILQQAVINAIDLPIAANRIIVEGSQIAANQSHLLNTDRKASFS